MDIHHINRLYLPAKERYEQLLREQPDVIHRAQLAAYGLNLDSF